MNKKNDMDTIIRIACECVPWMEHSISLDGPPYSQLKMRDDAPDEIKELFRDTFGTIENYLAVTESL